jgi:predicted nucleic acid-binding protein
VETGAREAWLADDMRSRHYDKKTKTLSLADCLLLAHAILAGDAIATADPPLAAVARVEGLDVIALPDSSGERP